MRAADQPVASRLRVAGRRLLQRHRLAAVGSLLHPVGSLPPGAYWLRRALVLAALIVTIGGGWVIASGGGGPSTAAAHSSTPAPTSTGTPTASTSNTPTPSVSHTASQSPAAITECPDSVIRVSSSTDSATYAAGVRPKLTVSVTNTGKVSCKRDIGRSAMGLLVSLGNTRVWSSADCSPGGQPAVAVLKPGQVFSSTVLWNRTSSKVGCPSGQPAAAAGSYTLVAKNLTLKSLPAPFVLH